MKKILFILVLFLTLNAMALDYDNIIQKQFMPVKLKINKIIQNKAYFLNEKNYTIRQNDIFLVKRYKDRIISSDSQIIAIYDDIAKIKVSNIDKNLIEGDIIEKKSDVLNTDFLFKIYKIGIVKEADSDDINLEVGKLIENIKKYPFISLAKIATIKIENQPKIIKEYIEKNNLQYLISISKEASQIKFKIFNISGYPVYINKNAPDIKLPQQTIKEIARDNRLKFKIKREYNIPRRIECFQIVEENNKKILMASDFNYIYLYEMISDKDLKLVKKYRFPSDILYFQYADFNFDNKKEILIVRKVGDFRITSYIGKLTEKKIKIIARRMNVLLYWHKDKFLGQVVSYKGDINQDIAIYQFKNNIIAKEKSKFQRVRDLRVSGLNMGNLDANTEDEEIAGVDFEDRLVIYKNTNKIFKTYKTFGGSNIYLGKGNRKNTIPKKIILNDFNNDDIEEIISIQNNRSSAMASNFFTLGSNITYNQGRLVILGYNGETYINKYEGRIHGGYISDLNLYENNIVYSTVYKQGWKKQSTVIYFLNY